MLAATPRRLEKLLAGAGARQLTRPPGPGKWSVAQILAHLADGEVVLGYRYRSIVGKPGCAILGYDQDGWAAAMEYARRPARRSLAAFRDLRRVNLEMLKALKPAQWKLEGVHNERGPESLEATVRLAAGHDLNHLRQIEAILAK